MGSRIKIPVQVFSYSLLLSPCVFGYFYYDKHSSREQLEEEIRNNVVYKDKIQKAQAKREGIGAVLKNLDNTADENFHELLTRGKSTKKRHYKVDEKLYGTEKGAEQREKYLESVKLKLKEQRAKKSAKKKTTKDSNKVDGLSSFVSQDNNISLLSLVGLLGGCVGAAALLMSNNRRGS